MVCSEESTVFGAAQIEVPSLDTRRADLPRIVNEYVEDAVDLLQAPDDCLDPEDIQWIMTRATLAREITIPGIEKAVLRAVAVRMTHDLTNAARLLGMARVSLERWMRRRE
jgi:DNA-binding NtrC family response regulator